MQFEIKNAGEVVVLKVLESRVDARSAPELRARLGKLVEEGHSRVVLDLSAVGFVDSSGLGAIVSSLKLLNGSGQLVISGVQRTVSSLFKVTRMDKLFRIVPCEADGVAALSP
jgi:anti-sigma B factor antagonist